MFSNGSWSGEHRQAGQPFANLKQLLQVSSSGDEERMITIPILPNCRQRPAGED